MSTAAAAPPSQGRQKPLRRRPAPGFSRQLRRSFQLAFLALNIWIGIEFYFFVRYYETGGRTLWVPRPPGIEGWLPIASLMNLKLFLATGEVPRVHPAGLFVLISFLAISWLLRKSFCSWLCPVGTISECLWRLGKQTFGRNFRLPGRLDLVLRGIKYVLLGLFLYAVGSMPASAIHSFLDTGEPTPSNGDGEGFDGPCAHAVPGDEDLAIDLVRQGRVRARALTATRMVRMVGSTTSRC